MNHLCKETSSYLLQHANNPVDWYPWNVQALQKAQQENKPILLSIGYAACHWCHVMARESFTDEETAALMNQWFINIKVDSEEHPELDKIYQTAHQLLTGRAGGWPLTVFLTPDQHLPFYAGTYFPVEESFGRPGFKSVLTEIAYFYYQQRDAIMRTTRAVQMALAKLASASAQGVVLNESPLPAARAELEENFDFVHGGFGRAPKFPLATHLNALLQYVYFSAGKDQDALRMLNHALTRMALGGLRDQLGGGFFRYCIDTNWMIPHFEKMLYDNAQLIALYSDVTRIHPDDLFKTVALTAVDWALHQMHAPQGGFYASLSADTEGVEGKYYYWDRDEIRQLLSPLEYSAIEDYFGLKKPPNFEGHWHLYTAECDQSIQGEWLAVAQKKLLAAREKRVVPSSDKKILTGWNALMIKALVKIAQSVGRPDLIDVAQKTLDFIRKKLWLNQKLLAVITDDRAHLPAYLDDYVLLLDALLEFLQVHWQDEYFLWAIDLAEQMLQRFYDAENGGFFYTAIEHEPLIQRLKIFNDEAMPSGNGIAVQCLLRLGYLLGNTVYLAAAEKTLRAAWEQINARPSIHNSLLMGLRYYFQPPVHVILRGEPAELTSWRQEFAKYYLPNHTCYALTGDLSHLPAALQKPLPATGANAYLCCGLECRAVLHTKEEFRDYLLQQREFCRDVR